MAMLLPITLWACSNGEGAQAGGHTNWLPCQQVADCRGQPEAVACKHGYCVDDRGHPVEAPANDAGNDEDATSREMDAAARQMDDASGPPGARDGGADASDSSPTQDARVSALDDASVSALDAASVSALDASVSGQRCGPTICPPRSHCCDACLGVCIPEGSGAFCPGGTPGTLCRDGGVADLSIPACPGPMARCASDRCLAGMACVTCSTGQVCLELELYCGPASGSTAQCVDWPCGDIPLSSACATSVCSAIQPPGLFATANVYREGTSPLRPGDAPILSCSGGGICAAPDTPIETPSGEVPISQLREGDLVYSRHEGRVQVVPLVAVARRPVFAHRVQRIVLAGGARLEISAPHPLADGRPLGALRAGDVLDGQAIVASELIDYHHPYTYDILPGSDSATYLAAGVWLGSTLR